MDTLRTFASNPMPGGQSDVLWGCVTITLSLAVALGYAVIAFQWFFQAKLSTGTAEAKASLRRLRRIFACCCLCGAATLMADLSWAAWRLYDVVLVVLGWHTWAFAARIRGLGHVDERLAQLDELERTANKYREIAELLPHIVWTATADGRVDFANRLWTEYSGGGPGVGGRTWLDAVHPAERPDVLGWWADTVRAGRPAGREVRLEGQDGYRTFALRATPIARGGAVKWLGACADVEDQKRLATERETQARQRSFFLNALSHDLRAPLNTVALNAHILKMSARDEADAEVANTVVENAIAAGELVTRLLDFARVGEERTTADRVLVAAVLHQVRRRFMPAAAKKGLYLRVVTAAGDVEVTTDRHKLDRVLSNLVDNAIKYTPHGGVELALEHSGGRACVCVSDTGGGIPKECAPYLFDEFYQVNNHERDRTKGFGLGLTICKSLARKLGGDVRLARTGPDGTCFEFTFDTGDGGPGGPTDGTGGRGRRGGAAGDCPDPAEAGLCRS